MTQLQAITGSCLKWWRIRYAGAKDQQNRNCPLCRKYITCFGCPIENGCDNTPYDKWAKNSEKRRLSPPPRLEWERWCKSSKSKETASAELQFLFDLIKPRYYPNVRKELARGDYPKKFKTWMERAIARKETP